MRERVVITGLGCVSCFGVGAGAFGDAIASGRCGVVPIDTFDTSACRSHRAAMIQGFDPAAFVAPMKLRRVDAVGRIALACARLAQDDAGYVGGEGGTDRAGVALGTVSAGLDSTVEYLKALDERGPSGVPAILFSNTVANAPASLCAIEFGLRGPNVTFNQREASSAAAIAFSVGAIRDGRVTAMVTGGVDQVEETLFKVYDRFHALSPRRSSGAEVARPFDRRRNGFVLGEGGFVLLIEAASSAEARGARVYGEVLGIGMTASATALNDWPREPEGLARAMRLALEDAGMVPDAVSAVIATANGSTVDRLESDAIGAVFGARRIPVTSIKGAIGESGAGMAAGIAAGVLTIGRGILPPTVGWENADPACGVDVSATPRAFAGDVFLADSVASGGTNAAMVVRVHGT